MRLENHPWNFTRRGFLVAGGVTGTVLLTGTSSNAAASVTGGKLSAPMVAVILAVARVGAVYPVTLPSDGEAATATRLRSAARRLTPARLALVGTGADALIRAGVPGHGRQHLLAQVGAAANAPGGLAPLTALVALAAGTVSRQFDPTSDQPAQIWVDSLRRLHQLGVQPSIR